MMYVTSETASSSTIAQLTRLTRNPSTHPEA
jgi:hypothetical protein